MNKRLTLLVFLALVLFAFLSLLDRSPFWLLPLLGTVALVPDVGKVEFLKRILYGRGGLITNATNATPIVITSNSHGLPNGASVIITDVGGNTAANGGPFIVGSVTTNTFALYDKTTGTGGAGIAGNGGYTSGGSWSLAGEEDITLKLYSNNKTPAETDTAGSYTECTFTGYSAKTLTSKQATTAWAVPTSVSPTGSWAPGAQTSVAESTYPQQSWTASSSQSVYGYFWVGATSTTLYLAQIFASVKNLDSPDQLQLTPRLGAANAS